MTTALTYEPVAWLIISTLGFLCLVINGLILYKEWKARKSQQITFITKYLKIFSISSIISSVLFALFLFLSCFNVFCYFSEQIPMQAYALQAVFMGLYQLERLRYCFSKSQVHSNKGYPNYIFIIMYTIGIFLMVFVFIYTWMARTPSHCGINNQYQFVFQYPPSTLYSLSMIVIATLIYTFWDLITLLLYIFKVFSFRKYKATNMKIYNRIMSILSRISILTITYEIILFGVNLAWAMVAVGNVDAIADVLVSGPPVISSIVMNLSMRLMQQHNTNQYKNFLFMIHKFKLHYICCCCCKSIIHHEMNAYSDETKLENEINIQEEEKKRKER